MGRVGWIGIIAGTAVALVTGRLLLGVVPNFHGWIPYEQGPGGGNVVSVERQATADALWAATAAVSQTLAYLLGGLVTGGIVRASHGFNGALVGACGALFGAIYAVLDVGLAALADPENGAQVFVGLLAFAVLLPIAVLASCLGGWVGGRLRRTVDGWGDEARR